MLKVGDVELTKKNQADGWSVHKMSRQLEVCRQIGCRVACTPAEPRRQHSHQLGIRQNA